MYGKLRESLRLFGLFLLEFGIDVRRIINIRHLFQFSKDYWGFIRLGGKIDHNYVILKDYNDEAGTAKGHYFHQDLLVAAFVYNANPFLHVDIGSRIDGFVAHVATFRKIKVFDIRPMSSSGHKNIIFEQVDLLNLPKHCSEVADSISCLHVIEHIGLGRYGDSLDPNGHIAAFKSLIKLLKKDGMLYVSFPIANSNKIYFNAHRVFESRELFNWIDPDSDIRLERFDYVDDEGNLQLNASLDFNGKKLSYGCGIYSLRKIS